MHTHITHICAHQGLCMHTFDLGARIWVRLRSLRRAEACAPKGSVCIMSKCTHTQRRCLHIFFRSGMVEMFDWWLKRMSGVIFYELLRGFLRPYKYQRASFHRVCKIERLREINVFIKGFDGRYNIVRASRHTIWRIDQLLEGAHRV